jgi:broad specificity phosphatase PhoE
MIIYFIRHGESEGNVEKRIQTAKEPLTLKGIAQAKSITPPVVDIVYSSPMKRAKDTAKLIFPKHKIHTCKLLEEKRNGVYEGKKISEIDWTEINKKPFMERSAPDGETLLDVQKRSNKFLKQLAQKKYAFVAVVSHATIMRVILAKLLNKSVEDLIMSADLKNCGAFSIEIRKCSSKIQDNFIKKIQLLRINDNTLDTRRMEKNNT